jgi:hypothetical protein
VAAVIVTAILMVPVTWIMLGPVFGLGEEPGDSSGTRSGCERIDGRPS